MNERILEAISKLKKEQDDLGVSIKTFEKMLNDRNSLSMQKALITVSEELAKYTIHNGNWYYSGKDTGIQAEAHDGKDGERGPQGIPGKPGRDGKDGKPGKDGKNGKDGKPGRDGKNGKDGKNGLPGKDGKDGISPELKIGKVEVSPEYGGALAKLRPGKDNILYLDLTLPRGPQGFTGFDGKDAKINGENTVEIKAGTNITIDQDNKTLTINSTGGGGGSAEDNITITKNSQNKIQTVGIIDQNAGGVIKYWEGTQAQYDAISTKDNNTIYYITDSEDVYITNAVDDLVNYYKKSETFTKQEVNNLISDYVTNTDYATSSVGGVVKVSNGDYGIAMDDGVLKGTVRTYAQYNNMSSKGIVCKGTLENVITGKSLVSAWYGTQAQYDALASIDPNTLYCIVES